MTRLLSLRTLVPGLLLVSSACVTTAPAPDPTPPELRLPTNARPPRYSVEFTVNPSQDTFQGKIDIDLEFTDATPLL